MQTKPSQAKLALSLAQLSPSLLHLNNESAQVNPKEGYGIENQKLRDAQ